MLCFGTEEKTQALESESRNSNLGYLLTDYMALAKLLCVFEKTLVFSTSEYVVLTVCLTCETYHITMT